MFEKAAKCSAKSIITILTSFVVTFIVINIVVHYVLPSYKTTLRASEMLLEANLCNFSDKDFTDIETMIKSDKKPKAFFLGDSITYGIGQKNQEDTYAALISEYSVYNLSSCGSKPLDYYLWIKYLIDLDSENSIFIIQYNYKWFNADSNRLKDRISQKRILFQFNKYLTPEIREKLDYYPSYIDNFASFLEKEIPIISNRTKLFAAIFKEKSKEELVEHLFFGKPEKQNMDYKRKVWSEKNKLKSYNCKIEFGAKEWDEKENFNYWIYLQTIQAIEKANHEGLVFLPAYNQKLVSKCSDSQAYLDNVNKFYDAAANLQSPLKFDLDDKYFLDEMHLTDEGHKAFYEALNSEQL